MLQSAVKHNTRGRSAAGWVVLAAALSLTVALTAGLIGGCRSEAAEQRAGAANSAANSAEPTLIDGRFTPAQVRTIGTLSPLPEVPIDPTNRVSGDEDAAHFGRFLFFDERLSGDGNVSCASCHSPHHGFSVPTRLSEGMGTTDRHPPSLLNVAHHRWYFWDGRADSLWAQQVGPLESPKEHGTTRTAVARLIASTPELRRAYGDIFDASVFEKVGDFADADRFPAAARPRPDAPDSSAHRAWQSMTADDRRAVNRVFTNVTKAIAAYEEQLVTGPAPFDRYVEGLDSGESEKLAALSPSAKRGLELFIGKARCVTCHNGANFTDMSFHNLGLGPRPWLDGPDEGRWAGTRRVKRSPMNATGPFSDARDGERADWIRFLKRTPEDHGQMKTPTLRNISRTAPYMHGGHFSTLEEVVRFYATLDEPVQIGHREESLKPLGLSQTEIDDLVAFLESLDGDLPPSPLLSPPESPVP